MDNEHLELISLFVDNLPEDVGLFWFRKFFSQYGVVKDAYIPRKRSKVTNRRFGFVRFDCASSAEVAISKANGFWIGDRMLYVKKATFKAQRKIPNRLFENSASQIPQKCFMESRPQTRGDNEERPTYAQVTRGVERFGEKLATRSIQCHSIGNGWLFRSAIAKIRKLLSAKDLINVFNLEKIHDVQIKAIGGRYVVITFVNVEIRDKFLKERWVKNWFDDVKPWEGEQAKEERFVWISCFGMPLSAWSSQTFKDIGSIWGDFLEVDENTLNGGSYEKGRILIATNQSQRIDGNVELVEDGMRYIVRIEEENSYRKVESSNFLARNVSMRIHEDQLSQVPKVAQPLEEGTEEVPNVCSFESTKDLESFVEDSMGLQSLFHEAHDVETVEKMRSHEKLIDVNLDDSGSTAKATSRGSDWDLVSDEPLLKYVEFMRHKKTNRTKKVNSSKTLWSKNSLKTTLLSRTVNRDSKRNASRSGSKKGSFVDRLDGDTLLDVEKEFQETLDIGNRLGVSHSDSDDLRIKEMIVSDYNRFAALQRHPVSC